MKNKILSFVLIISTVILSNITSVFAGYADFDEEAAKKQNEEMVKEQEKLHNTTEVKSSDNYLSNLEINGYTITPEFDKQTLEYTVKEEVKSTELNIKATANNEKAKVTGSGTIRIEDNKNDYRIDVTAENGSVRTYIIKINKAKETTEKIDEENEETKIVSSNEINAEENETNTNANIQPKEEKNDDNVLKNNIILPIIIVVIIFILVLLIKNKKKATKRKH